ncbi:Zinc finger, CCHC-type [Gossypium australe]|uniref:Zinc finger, CCHC-type n=1 Tax=Gossypium australe TaxID=47621 RepID=A0A5B6WDZ7_9ROSI|nr:Zinc finger, CCHC-type [Gossypium australe]
MSFQDKKEKFNSNRYKSTSIQKKGESVDQVEYARVICSLMYLMSCTRPDIAFIVNSLSMFTSNPRLENNCEGTEISHIYSGL